MRSFEMIQDAPTVTAACLWVHIWSCSAIEQKEKMKEKSYLIMCVQIMSIILYGPYKSALISLLFFFFPQQSREQTFESLTDSWAIMSWRCRQFESEWQKQRQRWRLRQRQLYLPRAYKQHRINWPAICWFGFWRRATLNWFP